MGTRSDRAGQPGDATRLVGLRVAAAGLEQLYGPQGIFYAEHHSDVTQPGAVPSRLSLVQAATGGGQGAVLHLEQERARDARHDAPYDQIGEPSPDVGSIVDGAASANEGVGNLGVVAVFPDQSHVATSFPVH